MFSSKKKLAAEFRFYPAMAVGFFTPLKNFGFAKRAFLNLNFNQFFIFLFCRNCKINVVLDNIQEKSD
jgi:hypothetical protein